MEIIPAQFANIEHAFLGMRETSVLPPCPPFPQLPIELQQSPPTLYLIPQALRPQPAASN